MDDITVIIKKARAGLLEENRGKLYVKVITEVEKSLIENVLEHTEGNQLKAARILGINRNTMRAKIKKLGINPQLYKSYR
ncbi:MAG: helix-turn-helix domain-containing protein [Candidatus Omnitrophota bacterium]|nr:helix-turn-helix domain-containing protein [Candidatus Omnitrophota bacterium]